MLPVSVQNMRSLLIVLRFAQYLGGILSASCNCLDFGTDENYVAFQYFQHSWSSTSTYSYFYHFKIGFQFQLLNSKFYPNLTALQLS